MRRKKVWRYYCNFCNKGGCSKWHMEQHEKHCTMNPDRTCRLCAHVGVTQLAMEDLVAALGDGDIDGMEKLRKITGGKYDDGCPVCILATIRQAGLSLKGKMRNHDGGNYPVLIATDSFGFKSELAEFWRFRDAPPQGYPF